MYMTTPFTRWEALLVQNTWNSMVKITLFYNAKVQISCWRRLTKFFLPRLWLYNMNFFFLNFFSLSLYRQLCLQDDSQQLFLFILSHSRHKNNFFFPIENGSERDKKEQFYGQLSLIHLYLYGLWTFSFSIGASGLPFLLLTSTRLIFGWAFFFWVLNNFIIQLISILIVCIIFFLLPHINFNPTTRIANEVWNIAKGAKILNYMKNLSFSFFNAVKKCRFKFFKWILWGIYFFGNIAITAMQNWFFFRNSLNYMVEIWY